VSDRIDGYAKAIVELARAEGELDRVETELYSVARAMESSRELRDTLTDGRIPYDRKKAIVDDLVGGRAASVTVNAISLVVAQERASDLPAIADRLTGMAAATAGKEVAAVRSAVPLDDATVARLAAALTKATGTPVEVRVVVDPSLMGGIVAQVGDTVFDGSVRRRLDTLKTALARA